MYNSSRVVNEIIIKWRDDKSREFFYNVTNGICQYIYIYIDMPADDLTRNFDFKDEVFSETNQTFSSSQKCTEENLYAHRNPVTETEFQLFFLKSSFHFNPSTIFFFLLIPQSPLCKLGSMPEVIRGRVLRLFTFPREVFVKVLGRFSFFMKQN